MKKKDFLYLLNENLNFNVSNLKHLIPLIKKEIKYKTSEEINNSIFEIECFKESQELSKKNLDYLDQIEILLLKYRRKNNDLNKRELLIKKIKKALKENNLDFNKFEIKGIF